MNRSNARPTKRPWYVALVLAGLLVACGGVAPDTTGPTVTATSPSSTGTAATNAPVTATFDEAIDAATLTTASFTVTGPGGTPVAGSVAFDDDTLTAVFSPLAALVVDTTYTATLTTEVTDLAGNELVAPVTWTFTTDPVATVPDTTAPSVTATTPSGTGTAPTNEPITATFDEAIDIATLTTTSFTLTGPGATPIAGTVVVVFDAAFSTAIYTPLLALEAATTYTATLSTDVADLSGNGLADPVSWTFTTDDVAAAIEAVDLRSAGDFVLLSAAGVSTTPGSAITGDIGVSPVALSYVTGFDVALHASLTYATSAMVTGNIYAANLAPPTPTKMTTAIGDMETAYTDAAGRTMPNATELLSGGIGGLVIEPGLYTWSSGVDINTDVTLTGSATDVWILQVAQDLTLANGISVFLTGGAEPQNVFWQVAGQVTLGTNSSFQGIVLSKTAIVMATDATFTGRALAQTGITLDSNDITQP